MVTVLVSLLVPVHIIFSLVSDQVACQVFYWISWSLSGKTGKSLKWKCLKWNQILYGYPPRCFFLYKMLNSYLIHFVFVSCLPGAVLAPQFDQDIVVLANLPDLVYISCCYHQMLLLLLSPPCHPVSSWHQCRCRGWHLTLTWSLVSLVTRVSWTSAASTRSLDLSFHTNSGKIAKFY